MPCRCPKVPRGDPGPICNEMVHCQTCGTLTWGVDKGGRPRCSDCGGTPTPKRLRPARHQDTGAA